MEREVVESTATTYALPNIRDRLPRRLGAWSATALVIGSIIGSGIFRVPAGVAANTGTVATFALAWIAGGVIALLGALAFAELSAMFPQSGGAYVYLREGYGRLVAFLAGWIALYIVPTSLGALSLVFAEYLGTFLTMSDAQTRVAAAAVLAVVAVVNYRSVRWGGLIQNASTGAKMLALAVLALTAFAFGNAGAGALAPSLATASRGWTGFGVALVAVLWAYNGWQDAAAMSGEVRDPGRTLPKALIGGTVTVIVIYLAVNAGYLFVLPLDAIARSPLVAADAMTRTVGRAGSSLVAAMVMVSTFGALNAVMMTQSRIFYAMAEDRLFFRALAAVHPRYQTPHVAVAFVTLLAIACLSLSNFEQLAEAFVVGVWPFVALAVGAVIVLRRTRPDLPRPYRTPGYPLGPIVFLLASLGLMVSVLIEHPASTAISIGITLLGVPVYFATRLRVARDA